MLDLRLFKGPRFQRVGVLDIEPHIKPTSQWTPLDASSAHHFNVHLRWPIAEANRLSAHSSSKVSQLEFREKLIHKLSVAGIDLLAYERLIVQSHARVTVASRTLGAASWLILPFRSEWPLNAISSAIARVNLRWSSTLAGEGLPPRVQCAWRLGGKHVYLVIRGASRLQNVDAFPVL